MPAVAASSLTTSSHFGEQRLHFGVEACGNGHVGEAESPFITAIMGASLSWHMALRSSIVRVSVIRAGLLSLLTDPPSM